MAIGAIGTDIIEGKQAEPAISPAMEEAKRRYLPRHFSNDFATSPAFGRNVDLCMFLYV